MRNVKGWTIKKGLLIQHFLGRAKLNTEQGVQIGINAAKTHAVDWDISVQR